LRYSLQNKQFVILMKISSKMAFENFKNFISFHETFKTKFSAHISTLTYHNFGHLCRTDLMQDLTLTETV